MKVSSFFIKAKTEFRREQLSDGKRRKAEENGFGKKRNQESALFLPLPEST